MAFEQPIGALLLTPRTLDRPFFSELAAGAAPASKSPPASRPDDWGRIYGGLFTGSLPLEFPLSAPQRLADNLCVLLNPAVSSLRQK